MRGQSPAPAPPGPPAGLKPTLAQRLAAMADRHPVYQEPPTPENPPTPTEALEGLTGAFPVAWVRQFDHHVRQDGTTFYADTTTGQMYDAIPAMHTTDGHDT